MANRTEPRIDELVDTIFDRLDRSKPTDRIGPLMPNAIMLTQTPLPEPLRKRLPDDQYPTYLFS